VTGGKKRRWRGRRLAIVPILYLAIGAGAIIQIPGWNEQSQYALVRSLHNGTARIDRYAAMTGDSGRYKGHVYSNKAPGLAIYSTPFYSATRALGVQPTAETDQLHLMVIFGCLLPFVVLLLLIDDFVERIVPGAGTATALLMGLGTLLLPFSTLFFSHVLAACLGFAAYYLLWLHRHRRLHPLMVAAAGVLMGFAVASEYPQGLLTAILACYALGRPASARRLVLFAIGVLIGVSPLLAYDWWAFGSPLRDAYVATPTVPVGAVKFLPFSLHNALDLLFHARGLLRLTPVLAAAVGGIFVLHRRGHRGEAAMAAVVAGAFLIFNACYYIPFGGWTPGPRYMIDALPFMALPLAAALRRAPLLTLILGAISAATMFVATVTVPELPDSLPTSTWWDRFVHGTFTPLIGSGQVVWFGLLALLAIAITAILSPRPRIDRRQLLLAVVGLAGWFVVERVGGLLLRPHTAAGEIALLAIVALAAAATWRAARGVPRPTPLRGKSAPPGSPETRSTLARARGTDPRERV
jgi:hypothetical protein